VDELHGRATVPAAGPFFIREVTDRNVALEAICWMLLRRYGIVFREVLTRRIHPAQMARSLDHAAPPSKTAAKFVAGRFVGGSLASSSPCP